LIVYSKVNKVGVTHIADVKSRVRDLEELAQKLHEFDDLYNFVDLQLGKLEAQAQTRLKSLVSSMKDIDAAKVSLLVYYFIYVLLCYKLKAYMETWIYAVKK
jgi:hypothetical protein